MKAMRLAAAVLLLLAAVSVPSQALVFYCDDICDCSGPCSLSCYTFSNVRTTCGQFGVCAGQPGCTGLVAAASAEICSVEP
ncbi:MAG TPA: hypothetical protein VGX68_16395 [Thermoanaerobaculia bacterium]|jgi:hypothetical protein|nr:hypothetical protein [Thermoanaerobaculia bacterium]